MYLRPRVADEAFEIDGLESELYQRALNAHKKETLKIPFLKVKNCGNGEKELVLKIHTKQLLRDCDKERLDAVISKRNKLLIIQKKSKLVQKRN